jgi:hypothetical protein
MINNQNIAAHTALETPGFQYSIVIDAATISNGNVISQEKTYIHPMANPHAGSRNRVAYCANEPLTGKITAISPRAFIMQNNMQPINV